MDRQAGKQINLGIFAHVDAGKTTLSEQLLAHAGAIRQIGSVDSGTTHTDNLPVERRRGISVKATCVSFNWRHVTVNLIDTPGHVDFSAEVERSIWALDAAVLVLCGKEGVQPQSEVLFRALQAQKIPVIIFVNKMDSEGADVSRVLKQIQRRLSAGAFLLEDEEAMTEAVCSSDDALLESYLNGDVPPPDVLHGRLAEMMGGGEAFPVLYGSALKNQGVEALMDAVSLYFPDSRRQRAFSGVAFASAQDKMLGRGVWVRLYGGTLENRMPVTLPAGIDPLTGEEKTAQRKITQIRNAAGEDVGVLNGGDIGVVYGLGDIPIGHIFGSAEDVPRAIKPGELRTPLITVQVIPEKPEQMQELRKACAVLTEEDPLLHAHYTQKLNELQLHVMGMIQLEIIQEELATRFSLNVTFGKPTVIFRETIAQSTHGFVAYTMPKPCWAILEFLIEPAPRGSGVTFTSNVPVKDIMLRYQRQVAQAMPQALSQGRLGWMVTDVKITLIGGNHHLIHTHPLDFIVATPMAIQDGLQRGGSVLLEPILEVDFLLPPDAVGRVMSDVSVMRGEVVSTLAEDDRVLMKAYLPVQTSMEYTTTLASVTSGRGAMSARLHGYRECPMELGATTPRRSVDPLDTSKYILAARNALESGIFDEMD